MSERSRSFGSQLRNPEVLVLGCGAVGKTLLIKQMKSVCSNKSKADKIQASYDPTVGVEIDHIKYKTTSFTIREVGSQMMMTWPSYFERCALVLFVVDKANRAQVSTSFVELLNLLRTEKLARTPMGIVFNKCDCPFAIPSHEFQALFRLDDLCRSATQCVTTLYSSAHDMSTVTTILDFIHKTFSASQYTQHRG